MTLEDILKNDESFRYQLLDRMRTDCNYYLGYGHRNEGNLWCENAAEQIKYMKAIWNSLDKKPEWLTMKQIKEYEKEMGVTDSGKKYYIKLVTTLPNKKCVVAYKQYKRKDGWSSNKKECWQFSEAGAKKIQERIRISLLMVTPHNSKNITEVQLEQVK